jgi:hypothetical protein
MRMMTTTVTASTRRRRRSGMTYPRMSWCATMMEGHPDEDISPLHTM